MLKNEVIEKLNKFNVDYQIYFYSSLKNKERISLLISYKGKELDGRHKISKLLLEYFKINYNAYFHKGILSIYNKID